MVTKISISHGLYALVNDEDAAVISPHRWYALQGGGGNWYAYRIRGRNEGCGPINQLMHQLLTGWSRVDHVNGNGLDNRRSNLRPATRKENAQNSRKRRNTSSRYKGVFLVRKTKRWAAQIYVSSLDAQGNMIKRKVTLGAFANEEAAALAYDDAARTYFGPFAAVNFPRRGERGALAT